MTPKKEFEEAVERDVQARVREGVKAILEEVLQEEMSEHLKADYRELTPTRRGERNGHYTPGTSSPPRARSSAWRFLETERASS